MNHQVELEDLFRENLTPEELMEQEKALREWMQTFLQSANQPGPAELLFMVEEEFGWDIRFSFRTVIEELRQDPKLPRYLRQYFLLTTNDDAIDEAIKGGAQPSKEFRSTLDDLFRKSELYRNSGEFAKAIEFMGRFRDYSPYNNMLVKVQKPACSFYATENDWQKRFRREVKEDARPLLILAPMHPVVAVYDIDDTEGDPVPDHLRRFAETSGDWNADYLERAIGNAEKLKILVQRKELGSSLGGFASTRSSNSAFRIRIVIHELLDERSQFAVLCHELGHVLLGHLGSDHDSPWPFRRFLTRETVELEAEAVAYIVCTRLGVNTRSAQYIASHMKDNIPESMSFELISKVAGKIEEMATTKIKIRIK